MLTGGKLNKSNYINSGEKLMRIKSVIFGDASNPSHIKLESVVTHALSDLSGNTMDFPGVYDNINDGLREVGAALKTSRMIFIFADENLYHETKRCISKAFRFEMIHNEKVLALLSKMPNSERYMMHASMPKNATVFPLSDGLYTGFAIRSAKQCIFFLPFSEDRTFLTIKKYVFPYISRVYGATLPSFNNYETAYSAAILENQLINSNLQIAVSNTPICKHIAKAGRKIECFNDHISFAPFDTKKADKKSIQQLAVEAAEYYECRFGAAIIEGDKDDYGNYTATIVVSNRKTATIRSISSIPDENHEDFINTVINEFFILLAHEIRTAPTSINSEQNDEKALKPKPVVKGFHILLYVALFATVFFATYVASSMSGSTLFS